MTTGDSLPPTAKPSGTNGTSNSHQTNGHMNGHTHNSVGNRANIEDPVCIIGMSCRLPGDSTNPSKLWDLLENERSGQCKISTSRFNVDAFYHPDADRPGSINTAGGYFLQEDYRQFENGFFGINNLEATYMDPQQRKLLEIVYECFESSGYGLDQVAGTDVGVYVGNFTLDWQTMQARDPEYAHRYSATGTGTTILGNRISHAFDLKGPSVVLDTACSSSLYGLHLACTAISNGDCESAIVAGANLITSPEQQIGTNKAGVLSATSTCHTFDSSADGYGRADGVAALHVKRLSAALRDDDPIRAIIRATAVNANGRTPGITQPSIIGQERVIREAYRKAGDLDITATSYVEAHGTGTPVGDPIEVEALSRIFSSTRTTENPLLIGSVKTNLGHSEAASGFSGIMKVVLAFENNVIPATIGIKELNPKIRFDDWNIKVVTKATAWPQKIRRAGVNSFGYGGANAHVILEAPESMIAGYSQQRIPIQRITDGTRHNLLLPLSASTEESLQRLTMNLGEKLLNDPEMDPIDLAYTLGTRRSKLANRAFVITDTENFKHDIVPEKLISSAKGRQNVLPITFVFTGQGAQWAQMGLELIDEFPTFRRCLQELDDVLQGLPERPQWTIEDQLRQPAKASQINEVSVSQTACTAVQLGLVALLREWGVTPKIVTGHSSGEIAAAYVAGLISRDEAICVAYYRGYVASKAPIKGTMLAAGTSPEKAWERIDSLGLRGKVTVACINSPENVTLSGNTDAIQTLIESFEEDKMFVRKLITGGLAYHSHHMKAIGQQYEMLLSKVFASNYSIREVLEEQEITMVSSVTGKIVTNTPPIYWRANLESPVRFAEAISKVTEQGATHIIELGPHSALQLPIKQTRISLDVAEDSLRYSPLLSRGKDSAVCALTLAGNLFLQGYDVRFDRINSLELSGGKIIRGSVVPNLPPYPWHYGQLYWSEPRASREFRNREYPRHELLGSRLPAGNEIDFTWRNLLKVKDVPWLADHKLETTVVFPGAGYLAMAIEAICQITRTNAFAKRPDFVLQSVSIHSALVIPLEHDSIEVFTTLRKEKLSNVTSSDFWYEFEVSSVENGEPTKHCTGKIKIEFREGDAVFSNDCIETSSYETWPMDKWYDQLAIAGLNFGPAFRSLDTLDTDRRKSSTTAVATGSLLQQLPQETYSGNRYVLHPVTLDGCIQVPVMASTAGHIRSLKGHVPVTINQLRVRTPTPQSLEGKARFHGWATPQGFGIYKMKSTLIDASGKTVAEFDDGRLQLYQSTSSNQSMDAERHPCLRVVWKPDVTTFEPSDVSALQRYIQHYSSSRPDISDSKSLIEVAGLLDLVTHKNPAVRILELGSEDDCRCRGDTYWSLLHAGPAFKKFKSYTLGSLTASGKVLAQSVNNSDVRKVVPKAELTASNEFDLILLSFKNGSKALLLNELDHIVKELLASGGSIISTTDSKVMSALQSYDLNVVEVSSDDLPGRTLFATSPTSPNPKAKEVVIVHRDSTTSKAAKAVQNALSGAGCPVTACCSLETCSAEILSKKTVVSLLELSEPLLSTMTPSEMTQVKIITDNAAKIVWATGGQAFVTQKPELACVNGWSRALVLEQPSLLFKTLSLENIVDIGRLSRHVLKVMDDQDTPRDLEFLERDGVLHVSRLVPDNPLNDSFRTKISEQPVDMKLKDAGDVRISIEKAGLFDTIYFKQDPIFKAPLPEDHVDVEIKAVGMNAKDVYVLAGKVDTIGGTSNLEKSGIVRAVGSGVTGLSPGDRVVVLSPGHFGTTERVPVWACQKMLENESFEVMATLPVVYCTAIYSLQMRANMQKGESVLIHSGAGGVGIAAIELALHMGAKVFATVSTESKKDFLVDRFGMPRENIFYSRDSSFVDDILAATGGRGVDVVLNSLTGDLLHESWRCCASFGRFVEIGKRDILDAGKLAMDMFSRNVTFSAFDLSNLYYHESKAKQDLWARLFKDVLDLYRAGHIRAIDPIKTFDISEVTSAFRHFSSQKRMGKIAVTFYNTESKLRAVPPKYAARLHPDKSYLLVGCLGGLGRSLTKWMVSQGARNFVFLGRSPDKPAAREILHELESNGMSAKVVKGDVCSMEAIEKCVAACDLPIGGVVQAAMGLSEALFTAMSHKDWHTGIQPKVTGTWNLHNALEGKDSALDFFLLTSSISGSIGTATESNYCSANGFLDAFARYRNGLNKPVCSLGLGMISEVGYLHENPEIEALLLRKGIQPLTEAEFLQVVDAALSQTVKDQESYEWGYDASSWSHILTGLEPHGVVELKRKGFDVNNGTMQDTRTCLLKGLLDAEGEGESQGWKAPKELAAVLGADSGAESLLAAVLDTVMTRLSNLVLIPRAQVDEAKPLAQYGMDSMLAAEFRTWFFQTFQVDIPFFELLSKTTTVKDLAQMVADDLTSRKE